MMQRPKQPLRGENPTAFASSADTIMQIKVWLHRVSPMVWRRVLVRISLGTGSEIRQPLGCAIVGGLLVSQLLTLFTTPVVYIYMDRLSGWFGVRSRSPSAGAVGGSETQRDRDLRIS